MPPKKGTRKKGARAQPKPGDKTKSEEQEDVAHPPAEALDAFLHKCEDIKLAASLFVNVAAKFHHGRTEELVKQMDEGEALLGKNDSNYAVGIQKTQNAMLHLKHHTKSKLSEVVESSAVLGLFSAFDSFTGDLLNGIYSKKPKLFEGLSRTV